MGVRLIVVGSVYRVIATRNARIIERGVIDDLDSVRPAL